MESIDREHLIDISSKNEIDRWCAKLDCDYTDLIKAVLHIGPLAARVNDYLELNRKKKNKK